MKPFRSIDFNDERKWKSTNQLDDVFQVGKLKAVGYIIENKRYTTKEFNLSLIEKQIVERGSITFIEENDHFKVLWAGDHQMMSDVYHKHIVTITKNNWPDNPSMFLLKLSNTDIDHKNNPDMYHVICDMFNSWCLHCEVPLWKKCFDGSTKAFSRNPYDPDKE